MTEPFPSPPPATLAATRLAAHRLAVYVISPARRRVTGRIGLRASDGGFTTPLFGDDESVRLEGTRLVRRRGGAETSEPVTTLAAGARFALGGPPDLEWAAEFDVPPPGDVDAPLPLDPGAMAVLAAWYRFGTDVLDAVRDGQAGDEPSEIQLWPEHFDVAFDSAAAGGRATFGASPGDTTSEEPYLYVLPPAPVAHDATWNAVGFSGAVLPLSGLIGRPDQHGVALEFLLARRAAIG